MTLDERIEAVKARGADRLEAARLILDLAAERERLLASRQIAGQSPADNKTVRD